MAFIISHLTGDALKRATAAWNRQGASTASLEQFLDQVRQVFHHPSQGKDDGEKLFTLRQGDQPVAQYAMSFHILAAGSGWNETALHTAYRRGLNTTLQSELVCRDEDLDLNALMALSIRLARRGVSRAPMLPQATPVSYYSEPMEVGRTQLSPAERQHRIDHHLCLYCGEPGHLRLSCPARRSREGLSDRDAVSNPTTPVPDISCQQFQIPVCVSWGGSNRLVSALIDSCSAGNFLSRTVATELNLPLVPCSTVLRIKAINGQP